MRDKLPSTVIPSPKQQGRLIRDRERREEEREKREEISLFTALISTREAHVLLLCPPSLPVGLRSCFKRTDRWIEVVFSLL